VRLVEIMTPLGIHPEAAHRHLVITNVMIAEVLGLTTDYRFYLPESNLVLT
jgi:hypothetical protein